MICWPRTCVYNGGRCTKSLLGCYQLISPDNPQGGVTFLFSHRLRYNRDQAFDIPSEICCSISMSMKARLCFSFFSCLNKDFWTLVIEHEMQCPFNSYLHTSKQGLGSFFAIGSFKPYLKLHFSGTCLVVMSMISWPILLSWILRCIWGKTSLFIVASICFQLAPIVEFFIM